MEEKKTLKHRVLEVLEGGMRGNRGAWLFSWTVFILILLSNFLYLLIRMEMPGEKTLIVFAAVELLTIFTLSAEIVLRFWTADVRFPEARHPRMTYLRQPMTIIGILALLPFYLELFLDDPKFEPALEWIELLTLLHLVKAWEIIRSSRTKKPSDMLKAE